MHATISEKLDRIQRIIYVNTLLLPILSTVIFKYFIKGMRTSESLHRIRVKMINEIIIDFIQSTSLKSVLNRMAFNILNKTIWVPKGTGKKSYI